MSKRTREQRESIATPQKPDFKRRKSDEGADGETTPVKPVTGIKWIPSEEEVADEVKAVAEEVKAVAAETEKVADEIKKADTTEVTEDTETKADEAEEVKELKETETTEEVKEVAKTTEEPKEEAVKATEAPVEVVEEVKATEEDKPETKEVEKPAETKAEPAETKADEPEATKTETKAEIVEKPSEKDTAESNGDSKPKHVFGSNSKFSGGFGAFKTGGSLWGKPATTTTTTPAAPAPAPAAGSYVFGSATKYSGGFSSVLNNLKKDEKSDNPWAEKKEEKKEDKEETTEETAEKEEAEEKEKEKEAEHYIGVSAPLAKKETFETGEEGEECVYTCRAKLYYFDLTKTTEGWKERGVGQVHINKLKPEDVTETCSGRIVMRTDAVHRVVLNMGLVKGLEVQAGMGASLSSDKVVRISTIEDDKPVQYALKTGNPDAAKGLLEGIKGLIPA